MKFVLNFVFPVEPFNTMVCNGTAGKALASVLEAIKPEAAYFYAPNGCRGGTMIIDLDDAAQIPSVAEPMFLKFKAECQFNAAMTPEDLMRAGLDELGKQWG